MRNEKPWTTIAPAAVQKVLEDASLSKSRTSISALAQEVVETQIRVYSENQAKAQSSRATDAVTSLFDATRIKIAEMMHDSERLEEYIKLIRTTFPADVLRRLLFEWPGYTLSYKALTVIMREGTAPTEDPDDDNKTDEWVLRNERYLRDQQIQERSLGLVRFSSDAWAVFPVSACSDTARTIHRRTMITGFTFLENKRTDQLRIQPNVQSFAHRFHQLTDGLLRGLDWNNVCVAGGIVLGALLCVDEKQMEAWQSSDIDIYIHSLSSPSQLNAKLRHIFSVYKQNLAPGAPVLVVRNAKTITFYSNYPIKRIQVILKIVRSPEVVLLNFDLDICAMLWDGAELWLLPRACRALETGYNVFTMNLIHGHYLGERRATQEQRVFKYAHRGYGIRVLPSYLTSLSSARERIPELSTHVNHFTADRLDLSLLASTARAWLTEMLKHTFSDKKKGNPEVYQISHGDLAMKTQRTEVPADRSSLSGFELLMRHVALFEEECNGRVVVNDTRWASTEYQDPYKDHHFLQYDDTPKYLWNENFTIDGFIGVLYGYNLDEADSMNVGIRVRSRHKPKIRRITYADSLDAVMPSGTEEGANEGGDILIPLLVSPAFAQFANDLIERTLREVVGEEVGKEPILRRLQLTDEVYLWTISSITMWQQLDRRIDEVHEVLWALRRANEMIGYYTPEKCLKFFKIHCARRAIRATLQSEFDEFARWVGREPVRPQTRYTGPEAGFSSGEEPGSVGLDSTSTS